MGTLIALAYAFPRVGMTGGSVRAEYTVTWGGVALIFLIAGLSLSLDALKKGLPHIQAHAVCSVFTYLVAPALALGFGTAGRDAGLDVYVMGGMVVTGGLPTTVASNLFGLFIQHLFPRPVARIRTVLHLAKVAAFLTSLCVWHSFSNAFASGAFLTASHASIIYLCFMSWASYLILTALVFLVVRLPGVPGRAAAWWRMSKRDSLALLFCGPAKGVAVGAPTIAILYADRELAVQAKLSLALVIYQGEQVAMAQVVVPLLRWWARDEVAAHEAAEDERLRLREIAKSRGGEKTQSGSGDGEEAEEKSVATLDVELGKGETRHRHRPSINIEH
ncbi:hypothetical protein CcaverHIS641_0306030 [Cutaneotrichosporon cavernicola]|nr:hypothetical protein CcaverHIS641_0306030 [Cutaneotrichosporon cavernicola]